MTPDEVLAMPNAKQLLQVRGHRPVHADKLSYLDMPEMRGLYSPESDVLNDLRDGVTLRNHL